MTKRILALHAHPDDIEILMVGTLALLKRQGHHITMATMTAGDCGSDVYPADEIARIRRQEASTAAAIIGAEYRCLEFKDLAIFIDDESRRRVTEAIRQIRPDIVITASPADYHCDHEATSRLVIDACFAVSAPNYKSGDTTPLPAIPHLYFADPAEGIDREGNVIRPQFVVDVESMMETKRTMLSRHESQRDWLKRQHGMDNFIDTLDVWASARGALIGAKYGEGFRQYMGHPYPRTPLLQELVGGGLVHKLS